MWIGHHNSLGQPALVLGKRTTLRSTDLRGVEVSQVRDWQENDRASTSQSVLIGSVVPDILSQLLSLTVSREDRLRRSSISPSVAAIAYSIWHAGWGLFFWTRGIIKGDAAWVEIGGYPFLYDMRDKAVGRILYLFRQYESEELAFVASKLMPGMTFVDIGANTGCYTLLGSKLVGPQGTVIAFEPGPENVRLLAANLKLNGLRNVHVVEKAVCDRTTRVLLHLSRINPGDHRTYNGDDDRVYNAGAPRKTTPVEGIALDEYLERSPTHVDVIKMDIQGSEHHALHGMMKTLGSSRGIILITEFWPYGLEVAGSSPKAFIEDLVSQEFRLYVVTDRGKIRVFDPSMFENRPARHQHATLVCSRDDLAG